MILLSDFFLQLKINFNLKQRGGDLQLGNEQLSSEPFFIQQEEHYHTCIMLLYKEAFGLVSGEAEDLYNALHRTYVHEGAQLEHLGDGVLELELTKHLFVQATHGASNDTDEKKLLNDLRSNNTLTALAISSMNLDENDSLMVFGNLAAHMEKALGYIFLTHGDQTAHRCVEKLYDLHANALSDDARDVESFLPNSDNANVQKLKTHLGKALLKLMIRYSHTTQAPDDKHPQILYISDRALQGNLISHFFSNSSILRDSAGSPDYIESYKVIAGKYLKEGFQMLFESLRADIGNYMDFVAREV